MRTNADLVNQQLQKVGSGQAPELKYLETPMSKPAREVLRALQEFVTKELRRPDILVPAFEGLDLYEFERNAQRVNLAGYRSHLKDLHRDFKGRREPFDPREVVASMSAVFADRQRVRDYDLEKHSTAYAAFPTEPHSADTYRWLTQTFLLADYEPGEVPKMVELCRHFRREDLVPLLEAFKNPVDRRINLIYARAQTARTIQDREAARRRAKEAEERERSERYLADLAAEGEAKIRRIERGEVRIEPRPPDAALRARRERDRDADPEVPFDEKSPEAQQGIIDRYWSRMASELKRLEELERTDPERARQYAVDLERRQTEAAEKARQREHETTLSAIGSVFGNKPPPPPREFVSPEDQMLSEMLLGLRSRPS